jgi:hypothetical protein
MSFLRKIIVTLFVIYNFSIFSDEKVENMETSFNAVNINNFNENMKNENMLLKEEKIDDDIKLNLSFISDIKFDQSEELKLYEENKIDNNVLLKDEKDRLNLSFIDNIEILSEPKKENNLNDFKKINNKELYENKSIENNSDKVFINKEDLDNVLKNNSLLQEEFKMLFIEKLNIEKKIEEIQKQQEIFVNNQNDIDFIFNCLLEEKNQELEEKDEILEETNQELKFLNNEYCEFIDRNNLLIEEKDEEILRKDKEYKRLYKSKSLKDSYACKEKKTKYAIDKSIRQRTIKRSIDKSSGRRKHR